MKMICGVKLYSLIIDNEVYFNYINLDEIPEKYKKEFSDWIGYQTRPVIESCPNAVYSWDWARWIESKQTNTEPIWD